MILLAEIFVMPHSNYFEIHADSYFELGLQEGRLFAAHLQASIQKALTKEQWSSLLARSQAYLAPTLEAFPQYIEELKGYAEGAGVAFEQLWALSLEDELLDQEKCTTFITNKGRLIGQNEDWSAEVRDSVCVLKKTIGDLTILELFYFNTLGGNAISINSNGVIQTINTLTQTDKRPAGIPRNVIARWLSESKDPEQDLQKFPQLRRSAGFSHTLINPKGEIWNIEASAEKEIISRVSAPFVHTNNYLTELSALENEKELFGTYDRCKMAREKTGANMTVGELKQLMSDRSAGAEKSLFNQYTIARMIIDIETSTAQIWLLAEAEKDWLAYPLDFLKSGG